ncbi:Oligopeptide transport ATP-binding protein OppD (TC 3.A.1.5.1) [Halorubrum sp. DM2]|uniref:ABC transporter ATP-binding protein n=1 Tax=Halorubrum sp. DM2 TaxID=2527867 RepID=UPI0024B704D6|nr:ABC transporter ATP-binding protein [Halorubrum sp. DM2]VTT85706.1 Oligopeptide transport ATP-binding protein OppD (TC 3.A.1.5.1) [Halorubrum sp. DM2]
MTDGPILSVEALRTTFHTDRETVRAVDGVDFDVSPGRTLGIVGESGSGKSVTARTILGLVDDPGRVDPDGSVRYHDPEFVRRTAASHPDRVRWLDAESDETGSRSEADSRSGTGSASESAPDEGVDDRFVTVTDGHPDEGAGGIEAGWVDLVAAPQAVTEEARGSEIAMVFQDAASSLNPVYTVGNQIRELLRIHRGLDGEEARRTAATLLEDVGIPDPERRLDEYPHQFSGGMQQRAAIALALACDPAVLLCDEPTTGLDVTIQAQILDLLERLQRERELAVVFITHDMGVISRIADTVAVMYAGEIVERASAERLFGEPRHPYTEGLLESIPGLVADIDLLPTIDGSVPTPNEPATSCRFAPRCPEAMPECETVHPRHVPVGDDATSPRDETGDAASADRHTAACLLYPESLSRRARLAAHEAADASRADDSGDLGESEDSDAPHVPLDRSPGKDDEDQP